jgi:hypothetical protein
MKIQDGLGRGYDAEVNDEHLLMTESIIVTELAEYSYAGKAYCFASGFISLTSTGVFSGMLYIKNNHDARMELHEVRVCGTALQQTKWIKKPTAGTLISAGTDVVPQNLNTASGALFNGVVKSGADALTVTDGALWTQMICEQGHCADWPNGAFIIAPGDSVAFVCKPSVAGTFCVSVLATV